MWYIFNNYFTGGLEELVEEYKIRKLETDGRIEELQKVKDGFVLKNQKDRSRSKNEERHNGPH